MLFRKMFLGCVAAVAMTSQPAMAETFRASIYRYSPISGSDCDRHSADLGARFGEQYGVSVIEAFCDWESSSTSYWTTRIRYDATEALPMISTGETASAFALGGTYKTAADCDAALALEGPVFTAKTGLAPFMSYCEKPSFDGHPWTLTVVAFGQTNVRPYVTASNYFGKIIGMTSASVEEMFKNGFLANGGELVQWVVEPSLGYGLLKFRYYGVEAIRFSELDFAKMRDANECISQRDEFASGLAAWSGVTLGSYCHQIFGMGSDIEMVSLVLSDRDLRVVRPTAPYADFNSCMAEKTTVIEHYRSQLNRKILAGLCGWNEERQHYTIMMVEQPAG